MSKVFFVDVDDVCARLGVVWLAKYNKDYNDNLTEDDLHSWGVNNYVKPECGNKIHEYLNDPHIYDEVKPREGSLAGVASLREMGFRVVFATSTPIETAGRKFYWLRLHGFAPTIKDYIEINDKSLLRGDYMFDDGFHNVAGFKGEGFLLTRPWNIDNDWDLRASDWTHLLYILETRKWLGTL